MEAVLKEHWYFVALVFLSVLKVAIQQHEVITVRLEEGMVLDCLCPWNGTLIMVAWTKVPEKQPVAVFHPEFGRTFSHLYRDRVEFLRNTPLDGSIAIRNVTHQDIGIYQCSVQTFPQGPWNRKIQVEDLDEPPEEDNDTVTPTSEVPTPDRELKAEQNQNLTINCGHQHNGTVYQVILERMLHGGPWGIIGVCKKVEGGLVNEDYSDRGIIDCTDNLDILLLLTDVTVEDSGFYRCSFNTDAGVQSSTVQLRVDPPGGFSLSLYMMYIYIGAGSAGLVLLIAIIVIVLRRRRKNKREEYRVKLHPFQRPPNIYANIRTNPRAPKMSARTKNNPIYANLQSVRAYQTHQHKRTYVA